MQLKPRFGTGTVRHCLIARRLLTRVDERTRRKAGMLPLPEPGSEGLEVTRLVSDQMNS